MYSVTSDCMIGNYLDCVDQKVVVTLFSDKLTIFINTNPRDNIVFISKSKILRYLRSFYKYDTLHFLTSVDSLFLPRLSEEGTLLSFSLFYCFNCK